MRWRCDTWHLPLRAARSALTALAALGHPEATVTSRPEGGGELLVWGRGGRLPRAVSALLQATAGTRVSSVVHDEAVLLAAHAPDGPVELAPGVTVDPQGRIATRGRIVLRIPPAPAFGDGRHPSTRLAARQLVTMPLTGRRVLDLGCGTGVLGLLAWRRGATRVDFADIDPGSVRTTRAACRANGLPRPRVWAADLLDGVRGTGYDLLIGNLYADLCLRLLTDPRLSDVLPTGGVVLSGIAHRRRAAVERALVAAGFRVQAAEQEAWWWMLAAAR
jgi:ribosomal protein L11 methylase PrmA